MSYRPHPKHAFVDVEAPDPWSTSDRSGFIYNHSDLRFQWEWAGPQLINKRLLVGPDEYDKPQEQLRSLVLPPDPPVLFNARPENYTMDEDVQTGFEQVLDQDSDVGSGDTFRTVTPLLAFGGSQVQVTFQASSVTSYAVANCSIGVSNGNANTSGTPTELLFNGTSGFSIDAGATILSDWMTLSTSTSDAVVVIFDRSSGAPANSTATLCSGYYKASDASYASATVSGFTLSTSCVGFNLVEVI